MSSRVKSYFHYLIGFKFKNESNHVKTAYLDTYNANFKHGSTVDTYNIHEKVFLKFASYFVQKFTSVILTRKLNNDRKFESFLKINNLNTGLLFSYINYITFVMDIINDYDEYNLNSHGILECIRQIINHYNVFIETAQKYKMPDYKIPVYLPDVKPFYHTLTREYHRPLYSQVWSSFEPSTMIFKGPGYLVTDYYSDGTIRNRHFDKSI